MNEMLDKRERSFDLVLPWLIRKEKRRLKLGASLQPLAHILLQFLPFGDLGVSIQQHLSASAFFSGLFIKDTTMRQQAVSSPIQHSLAEPISGAGSKAPMLASSSVPTLLEDEQRPAVLAVTPAEAARLEMVLRLNASGYVTWAAGTVREALELAEQMPPDVIVLDLDEQYEAGRDGAMISGFRLLHLLRRLTSDHPVALVVVTRLDYAEVEGAVRASADALVNKPVLPEKLLSQLRAALERVRSRYQQSLPHSQSWQVAGKTI